MYLGFRPFYVNFSTSLFGTPRYALHSVIEKKVDISSAGKKQEKTY